MNPGVACRAYRRAVDALDSPKGAAPYVGLTSASDASPIAGGRQPVRLISGSTCTVPQLTLTTTLRRRTRHGGVAAELESR